MRCLLPLVLSVAAAAQAPDYATLTPKSVVHGFHPTAVYLNASNQPFGARFQDARTKLTVDVLRIESVPQAYLWVNSFPTSDMGEPHTQEHLLLGHGNKGRNASGLAAMSMVQSSAHTEQRRTVYHYNTSAGPDVFFRLLDVQLDSLLHPDYTDEEIRREVRHIGVSEDPRTKALRLEEKGTVYQEMVSSMTQPSRGIWYRALQAAYGEGHPLTFNAGGTPEGIRHMEPSHIRDFHRNTYHLGNMAMILSLPRQVSPDETLRRLRAIIDKVQPKNEARKRFTEKDLPPPRPMATEEVLYADFPHRNPAQPGLVRFMWPADLTIKPEDHTLLDLFGEAFGGDATTNLYKLFVDTKTRKIDIGAKSASFAHTDEAGKPLFVALGDVDAAKTDRTTLEKARDLVLAELQRIASFADNSPELKEFHARLQSRIVSEKRAIEQLINSPPQFGFRGGTRPWQSHLDNLNERPGFRKQVNLADEFAAISKLLSSGKNIWREKLAAWKLTSRKPAMIAARPDPSLIEKDVAARKERLAAEMARLREQYKASSDDAAIAKFRTDYDGNTAALEKQKAAATHRFIENPPLTLDDQLVWTTRTLKNDVPLVMSTFESMTSGTVGLALRLDGVTQDQLVYLALLPELLTGSGVIRNGEPLTYEQMRELQRKEILFVNTGFASNSLTDRIELTLRGAGNDAAEAQKAVEWMRTILTAPNWRRENLPRMRDVVDQNLAQLRRTMQMPEERWVRTLPVSWRKQNNSLYLTATNFFTQTWFAHRLRWMLKDAEADRDAAIALLKEVEAAGAKPRAEIRTHLAGLKKTLKGTPLDAVNDLELLLADIPDPAVASDWTEICKQMQRDLQTGPDAALAGLEELRKQVARTGNARLFAIASGPVHARLAPSIDQLLAVLEPGGGMKADRPDRSYVTKRLRERSKGSDNPLFVGLVAPGMTGGVAMLDAPSVDWMDRDKNKLLDYLASLQFAGGGAHSAFMRTWGAGLAYSNGLSHNLQGGRQAYYAERTPEIPQTVKFVTELIRSARYDPAMAEYSIAQAFYSTSAGAYETRGESIAAQLADQVTPDKVSGFRKELLTLRKAPTLAEDLHSRSAQAYGRVLPGLGTKLSDVKGGVYFAIGPENQLAAWEQYLQTVEGDTATLERLYPRDFWIVH